MSAQYGAVWTDEGYYRGQGASSRVVEIYSATDDHQLPRRSWLEEYFHLLVRQWHEERNEASSSISEVIACPAYLRIIAMGSRVLPLIIEQLKSEGDDPDHWCAALEAITGENPVPENAHGDTVRIAQAWIDWSETAWLFRISREELTSESQVLEHPDITALPGQRSPIDAGGGLVAVPLLAATGLPEYDEKRQ